MVQLSGTAKYKPYSVFTPPFDSTSGGIRVMYGLYAWLLVKGQIAYINTQFPHDNFIAIYPEITHGNPLGAGCSVRYILQTPGVMMSYGVPSPTTNEYKTNPIYKNDQFYIFSKIYDTFNVKGDNILFLPILDLHIFKDNNKKRTQTCYLVGKGQNQFKHPKDSIEITRELSLNPYALAEVFNKCKVFYCYDRLSAQMDIARLCGCRVQYYGDFSYQDLQKYETGMNGLGYTDEKRQLDILGFRDHYKDLIDQFSDRMDYFISQTQS